MNQAADRRRKNSIYDSQPPSIVASQKQTKSRRRKCPQSKRSSRDKDFFVPDEVEEWVLPEYRSLFHHLFLKEDEESGNASNGPSSSSGEQRRRKISPTGSTGSSTNDEEGPLCNLVKSFPSWLKKVFNISQNEQPQTEDNADRHAWLDEIPIEICDRLRHIHIYV